LELWHVKKVTVGRRGSERGHRLCCSVSGVTFHRCAPPLLSRLKCFYSGTFEWNVVVSSFFRAARLLYGQCWQAAAHVSHQFLPESKQRVVPSALQRCFSAGHFRRQVCAVEAHYAIVFFNHGDSALQHSSYSHDNARFLNKQTSQQLYRNALTMVLFSVGIPMCASSSKTRIIASEFITESLMTDPFMKQRLLRHGAGVLWRKRPDEPRISLPELQPECASLFVHTESNRRQTPKQLIACKSSRAPRHRFSVRVFARSSGSVSYQQQRSALGAATSTSIRHRRLCVRCYDGAAPMRNRQQQRIQPCSVWRTQSDDASAPFLKPEHRLHFLQLEESAAILVDQVHDLNSFT
jgi:hypothetical protein